MVDPDVAVDGMLDPHRVPVDEADRLESVAQVRDLVAFGFDGPYSSEPFAREVQELADPEAALGASDSRTEAAVLKALKLARKHGARTALDIGYRLNLWGVASHGEGESRFVESEVVTQKLQSALHLFDLIVGTEEEFHIAGGLTDTLEALRAVRAVSDATLVCKRGAKGAVAFEAEIPDSLDDGQTGFGFRSRCSTFWAPATALRSAPGAGLPIRTGRPASS